MTDRNEGKDNNGDAGEEKAYRKVINSWAMYDWANSAFATTIMAAIFPVFFKKVAKSTGLSDATATAYWGFIISGALLIIAVLGPVLGAISDCTGRKKRFLAFFAGMGIIATAAMFLLPGDSWYFAAVLYILGNIGFAGGNVFYESLLPHITKKGDVDRVSARGYAFGYIGGGLLLAVNAALIISMKDNQGLAARLCFISVAIWWAVFSIPFFRNVPDTIIDCARPKKLDTVREGLARLGRTFREVRRYKHLCIFLIAFLIYNDGIGTIIKMAVVYGEGLGIGTNELIGALLLVQFVAFPATLGFGAASRRVAPKILVLCGLGVYAFICIFGFFMANAAHFFILAGAVGLVQGGTQALTRSLFSSMTPKRKSSEFFGFISTTSKFGAIVGPFQFALITQLTGAPRWGILSIIAFFAVGGFILLFVDVEKGRSIAREEDAAAEAE